MRYFDYTATTPMTQHAIDSYVETAGKITGNPSSTHSMGLEAAGVLSSCRERAAKVLHVPSKELTFTSGGTESDSIVIQSLLLSPSAGEIIVTGIEHAAILENKGVMEAKGWKFTVLDCPAGFLDPSDLEKALNEKVRMVCIMKVNNVTGSVQDIKACAKVIRRFQETTGRRIHLHVDAVQAIGKVPFDPIAEDADSAAFSSHKFGGPRGIGMLWCRNSNVRSLSKAGGQEKGIRPGTENLPAIAAMTTALEDAINDMPSLSAKAESCRKMVVDTATRCGFKVLSPDHDYSPFIVTISVEGTPSEVFLRLMDDRGFCLSAGSACSANSRGKAEGVLAAMHFNPSQRMSSIRISFGRETTIEDTALLCQALEQTASELKGVRK